MKNIIKKYILISALCIFSLHAISLLSVSNLEDHSRFGNWKHTRD